VPDLIDVSQNNDLRSWSSIAKHVAAAYIEVSDGNLRNPHYADWIATARKQGIAVGPYEFARVGNPSTNANRTGAEEARMVIGFAKASGWPSKGDLPLGYDFETLNGQTAEKAAKHLVDFVGAYQHTLHHFPGIYTMPSLWAAVLPHLSSKDRSLLARCFLWLADWGVSHPPPESPFGAPAIWQDRDDWHVDGISGNVDHSRILVDLKRLTLGDHHAAHGGGTGMPHHGEPDHHHRSGRHATRSVPSWVPDKHAKKWQRPWTHEARSSDDFKHLLRAHGLLAPHFTVDESRCHDPARTLPPGKLLDNAQQHAFHLEVLRHELGDKPLPSISWYRTPAWNAHVGGASQSRHMEADATDYEIAVVDTFGRSHFDDVADRVFKNDGFGTYPSGARHVDSRGTRARWSSF
jgi:GH25 family lysozyme M1 (1,4-beta-N-acetylmuramidase)